MAKALDDEIRAIFLWKFNPCWCIMLECVTHHNHELFLSRSFVHKPFHKTGKVALVLMGIWSTSNPTILFTGLQYESSNTTLEDLSVVHSEQPPN